MKRVFSFERTCLGCGLVAGATQFFKKTNYCHECSRRRRSEAHGWSAIKYDRIFKEQEGSCAICSTVSKDLVIDHDHRSGYRRGLLCSQCNTGLGQFKDSPELIQKAVMYLLEARKNDFKDSLSTLKQ